MAGSVGLIGALAGPDCTINAAEEFVPMVDSFLPNRTASRLGLACSALRIDWASARCSAADEIVAVSAVVGGYRRGKDESDQIATCELLLRSRAVRCAALQGGSHRAAV